MVKLREKRLEREKEVLGSGIPINCGSVRVQVSQVHRCAPRLRYAPAG